MMPEETIEVIKAATSKGWEAGLLAIVFVACVGALALLIKTYMHQAYQREERMAKRIDGLEEYQRTQLNETVKENIVALNRLTDTLQGKPCLLSAEKQREFVEAVADRLVHNSGKRA